MRTAKKPNRKKSTVAKRTRPIQVKIYMNEQEYAAFQKKLSDTDMSARAFILNAISGAEVVDADTRKKLIEINSQLKDLLNQTRGMGVNHNQMAKVANASGNAPAKKTLEKLTNDVMDLRKEVMPICQSLSQLIQGQLPKQP